MFTRRHYEAIAKCIRERKEKHISRDEIPGIQAIQWELECLFENDNPNFNRERFIKACIPAREV